MSDLPDYVLKNRSLWDEDAANWVAMGERAWRIPEPNNWGIWQVPESELRLIPDDMTGMRAIELGCGTAYVSAWMARRGADVVGVDNSAKQLDTARRLAAEHGVDLRLIHGNAEKVPYPDSSFDFAISEYGASIWCDPYEWIPEAHRLLRTGAELSFLGIHPLVTLTQPRDADLPTGHRLLYPYFGMHRIDWDDGDNAGTEFNLPISEWMRLFGEVGFDILAFHEIRSPGTGEEFQYFTTADWANDYPSEMAWKLCKR